MLIIASAFYRCLPRSIMLSKKNHFNCLRNSLYIRKVSCKTFKEDTRAPKWKDKPNKVRMSNCTHPWRTAVSAFLGPSRPHLRRRPSLPPPPPQPSSLGTPPAGSRVGEGTSGCSTDPTNSEDDSHGSSPRPPMLRNICFVPNAFVPNSFFFNDPKRVKESPGTSSRH